MGRNSKSYGFWIVTDKEGNKKLDPQGNPYMSGKLPDGSRAYVYKNNDKSGRQPDYNLVVYEEEKKEQMLPSPSKAPLTDDLPF